MRQVFAHFCKTSWNFEVDPMDKRLEIGHLLEWGYYFDEFFYDDPVLGEVSCEVLGSAWENYLENKEWLETYLVYGCYVKPRPNWDSYEDLKYDLIWDEIGFRAEIMFNLS